MTRSDLVVPQLATVEVRGMTRGAFILRGALAAGAVYGGSAVGPFVKHALAQEDGGTAGDIDILNFALTLETLEQTFYQEGLRLATGLSGDLQSLAQEIQANEAEHVEELTKLVQDLGGQPADAPEFDFGDAFQDSGSFLELAQTFEDTGVSAYNGAAPAIQEESVLTAAASIVQVEARHAALIRLQRGEEPAPTAFDETLDEQEVLEVINPFIVEGGGATGGGE